MTCDMERFIYVGKLSVKFAALPPKKFAKIPGHLKLTVIGLYIALYYMFCRNSPDATDVKPIKRHCQKVGRKFAYPSRTLTQGSTRVAKTEEAKEV